MFKKYRLKKGFTQEQLAEKLDMSWRQYQRIDSGESIPTLDTFKRLIKVLNIPDKDVLEYLKK